MNNVFNYWFKHWVAFQFIAIRCGCWKFRFIFHDIEKPFFRLFFNHKIVSKIHRKISRHHVEFIFPSHYDYIGMIIDWECSRFTKKDKQLNARDTLYKYYPSIKDKILPLLDKLKL